MSQTSVRRCQSEGCRKPLIAIDHGEPYPLAGAEVLCFDPMTVQCPWCRTVSTWDAAKVGK